jgi:hypothetical protein
MDQIGEVGGRLRRFGVNQLLDQCMADKLQHILVRAIDPSRVVEDGPLTTPRSYGVYELPASIKGTRRWRFGNHPIRQRELAAEYGSAKLEGLFLERQDAATVARLLNHAHD